MDTAVSFEIAQLLQEKGFDVQGHIVYDLQDNNKLVNFKDIAAEEFISDCETGYRDKGLGYFKENYKRIDDNTDVGYFMLAPTIAEVIMWLYKKHGIWIGVQIIEWGWDRDEIFFNYSIHKLIKNKPIELEIKNKVVLPTPEQAYEAAITHTLNNLIKT